MKYTDLIGKKMNLKKLSNIKIYGDIKCRDKNCPTESQEQMTFFNMIRSILPHTYGRTAFHQRNESKRSYKQASFHKAEGMTKGVPDIVIPGKVTFLCELKRQDHTLCRISDEQIKYLEVAQKMGAFCCVALGWESALAAFEDYLKNIDKKVVLL